MKSVVLIGDSIRVHYQPWVVRALEGAANVWGPPENCRSSNVILDNLDTWGKDRSPDVIHLNCGLHDIRRDRALAGPQVSLPDYTANLDAIFGRLRDETSAVLVWATITPINEARHRAVRDSHRYGADVTSYNIAARELAERHGAIINDLYGAVASAGADSLLKADGLHFTDAGSAFLAHRVVESLRPLL